MPDLPLAFLPAVATFEIGPFRYQVFDVDPPGEEELLGSVDFTNFAIYVKPGMPDRMRQAVLIHELEHIVLQHAGVTIDDSLPAEKICGVMEVGWLDILVKNGNPLDRYPPKGGYLISPTQTVTSPPIPYSLIGNPIDSPNGDPNDLGSFYVGPVST